jgi:hypothetical protein
MQSLSVYPFKSRLRLSLKETGEEFGRGIPILHDFGRPRAFVSTVKGDRLSHNQEGGESAIFAF